ncbi:MAG: septal ring lytic transglycosylase RlpA family protein [Gammaproteobacteria bacterium]|nr:septal ring lytic transglycosylase RlpA family protein [Gammaproteobacteria bacterium]
MRSGCRQIWQGWAAIAALALLVGCASNPPSNPNDGRYSIHQDRAPDSRIDIASIPDVIPEPINRTGAGNRSPYTVLGKSYTVMPTEEGYSERGLASWYGEKFHGHRTSNGEIFDMYSASAAHKSLPIPSFLQVTNLDNNRSIVVRVNDRGPFHGDRIIDLSYAAAMKLGYADMGTTRVQLDAIMPPASSSETRAYPATTRRLPERRPVAIEGEQYLQVGAFSDPRTAERISRQLREITSLPVFIQVVVSDSRQELHRVRVGPIIDSGEIANITERVVAANLGNPYTVTE